MAEANIIDGKAFAEKLRRRIGLEVDRLKASHNLTPGLAVVLVGWQRVMTGPWRRVRRGAV